MAQKWRADTEVLLFLALKGWLLLLLTPGVVAKPGGLRGKGNRVLLAPFPQGPRGPS